MLRKNILYLFIIIILVTKCNAKDKPHLILIVADDLGWNDVSWHNPDVVSPNLGDLAKSGIILDQSYVLPICSPTRSSLMTGRYAFTIGRQHTVIWPFMPTGLTLNHTIMPEVLKKQGYSTHAVGKWHLGFCSWKYTPTYRGFDTFYGYYTGAEDYYSHMRTEYYAKSEQLNHHASGYDFRKNTKPAFGANNTYSAYAFARHVGRILENRKAQKPLFLYMAFQSVHAPLMVPKNYSDIYKHIHDKDRRTYLGMVTAMDEAVGHIVDKLKETGHYNNSVIVFTTDNGGPTRWGGNNYPLRGNKTTLWEGGTRGSAFIHSPLLPTSGYTSENLIHVTDWMATFAHLAGAKVDPDIDGVNQWESLVNGDPSPRKEMIYNIDDEQDIRAAIRVGDYKLLVGSPGDGEWIPPPEMEKYEETSNITDTTEQITFNSTSNNSNEILNNSNKANRNFNEVIKIFNELINMISTKNTENSELKKITTQEFQKKSENYKFNDLPVIRKFDINSNRNINRENNDITHIINETSRPKRAVKTIVLPTLSNRDINRKNKFHKLRKVTKNRSHKSNMKNFRINAAASKKKVMPKYKPNSMTNGTAFDVPRTQCKVKNISKEVIKFDQNLSPDIIIEKIHNFSIPLQLFNLKVDPNERNDLAAKKKDIVKLLLHRLLSYLPKFVKADLPPEDYAGDPVNFGGVWSPGWC